MSDESVYTFYYEAFCPLCGIRIPIPVEKTVSDIPERSRDEVLEQLSSGAKLRWPSNPSENEVKKLMEGIVCSQNRNHHVEFIWPLGGA